MSKLEAKIEQNLSTHKKNLEFFQENDNCPTCTQPLEAEFRGEKIAYEKGKLVTLNDGMKKLIEEIAKQEELITAMEKMSNKMYELNVDASKLQTSIDEINKYLIIYTKK